MDLSLFFAGTAGSVPTARRGLPALLLRAGGDRLLFDCGEGTQQQLLRSVGLPELDAIFITHYHLDHWLGLLGTLKTFDLRGRERPLSIYGPPGLRALMNAMRPAWGRVSYPLALEELDPHEEVAFDGYVISPFPVEHRLRAYGYAFVEQDRPGRFDAEAAARLGRQARPGLRPPPARRDGRRREPEQVVGEPRAGRRIVISGDTAPCQATEVFAHRADLLVHEATFLEDELERARETGHSTARQAAEIAATAEVRLLALTHLSTRYFPRDVRDEARAVFANTVVPRDFDSIEVPFPERGRAAPCKGGCAGTVMSTIAFFPEGAYGPTNNCVGIGDVLRRRGHRVVFIVEESFAGTLEAQGFEERLMRLAPPPEDARGPRPVLEGLHPRDRAGVPQADDRAARRVHRPDLPGADRRRRLRRRAPARDHRRARSRT